MGEVEPHFEGIEVVAEGEFEAHAAVDGAGVGGDEVLVHLDGAGNGVHDGGNAGKVFFLVAQVPGSLFGETGATGDAVELSIQGLHQQGAEGLSELGSRRSFNRFRLRGYVEGFGERLRAIAAGAFKPVENAGCLFRGDADAYQFVVNLLSVDVLNGVMQVYHLVHQFCHLRSGGIGTAAVMNRIQQGVESV